MRKTMYAILLLLALTAILISRDGESKKNAGGEIREAVESRIMIVYDESDDAQRLCALIADQLESMSCKAELFPADGQREESSFDCAVFVETAPREKPQIPYFTCAAGMQGGRNLELTDLCPRISPRDIARAALLLLPDEERYFVLSGEEGAADVQKVCDLLDRSGKCYTVAVSKGGLPRQNTDDIFSEGYNVIILPYSTDSARGTVLVRDRERGTFGTLASFCADEKRLARAAAEKASCLARSVPFEAKADSYLTVCVDAYLAKSTGADIEALKEDYKVRLL